MDLLFSLWVFDNRWLFKMDPPLQTSILTIPILFNIISITAIIAQKLASSCQHPYFLVEAISMITVLSLTDLFLLVWVKVSVRSQLQNVHENAQNISRFLHQFQFKRIFWSWTGLIICIVSLALVIDEGIHSFNSECQSYMNAVKFYIDLSCLVYILAMVLAFLVFKISYLIFAWKFPQQYLKYKDVLQQTN